MGEQRRIVTILALFAIILTSAAPSLAQTQVGTMSMEQSNKDIMATLTDMKDTSIPASFMKTAGLETMTTPGNQYTLFIASDSALKSMSPDTKNEVMKKLKDKQMGAEFVRGHLVNGMVTPDQLTDGRTLTMMNGMTMKVSHADGRTMVDDANIIKAVRTSNGMIYVMDRIPSSIGSMMGQMGMLPASSMPAKM